MAANIVATYSSTYERIGVQLTGWAADVDTTVYRVDPTGARTAVRSAEPINVSGGLAFAYDYEFPYGTTIHYEAENSGTTVASADLVTPSRVLPYVRSPFLPSLNLQARVREKPITGRRRPRTVIPILNNSKPVVRFGKLGALETVLTFRTTNDTESAGLEALLEQGIVQVYLPTKFGTRYMAVGDVRETPLVGFAYGAESADDYWWEVELTEIDRPVGSVFGDPNASWTAVKATYASWAAAKIGKATWLDVLKGVP